MSKTKQRKWRDINLPTTWGPCPAEVLARFRVQLDGKSVGFAVTRLRRDGQSPQLTECRTGRSAGAVATIPGVSWESAGRVVFASLVARIGAERILTAIAKVSHE